MRKISWIALAALFAAPVGVGAQQKSQSAPAQSSQASQAPQESQSKASAGQEDTLAAAARKAREERKNAPKAVKVFTNDNLPTAGGVSTVGQASAPATPEKNAKEAAASKAAPAANDAATWRAKFAKLRAKLQRDQNELSVMQRELGVQQMQYYNGNPQKAAEDQSSGQPMGEDYNKKRAAIDAKQKQVEADQQAIDDAETALRQAGGDPGWAR